MNRFKEFYETEIISSMMKKFSYKNKMAAPRIDKVVINIGLGEARDNTKVIDAAHADIMIITGQKPITTKAKKSIANFKLRAGMPIGCKVTLRSDKMYSFMDRLINVAIPRVQIGRAHV